MWVQLRREVSREEFDDATILFLFESRADHLPVFREVRGFVLGTSGLVFAPDYRDFVTYEFFRGDCAMDGFFPGVCKCPDVVECM